MLSDCSFCRVPFLNVTSEQDGGPLLRSRMAALNILYTSNIWKCRGTNCETSVWLLTVRCPPIVEATGLKKHRTLWLLFFFQARRRQDLPGSLSQYRTLNQLQTKPKLRQAPAPPRAASLPRQGRFSMLLTSPANRAPSALKAVCIASRRTQVRLWCIFWVRFKQTKSKDKEAEGRGEYTWWEVKKM